MSQFGVGGWLGRRTTDLVKAHLRVGLVDANPDLLLVYLLLVLLHHGSHFAAAPILESQVRNGIVRQI